MITVGTDTYITLADARAYANAFGLSGVEAGDPDDSQAVIDADAAAEAKLKVAAKTLDRWFNNRYLGIKKIWTQPMAWPRNVGLLGTYQGDGETWNYTLDSDGNPRDFSGIPVELGEAQVELVALIQDGLDPLAQIESAITQSLDRLDVLISERHYEKSYRVDPQYRIKLILRPLLTTNYGLKATRGA